MTTQANYPTIRPMGLDGMLVSFAGALSEPANRAALAFRAALAGASLPGVKEMSTSLVSVYIRFDPGVAEYDDLRAALRNMLASRSWLTEALPSGRTVWRVPTVYGGEHAPQLNEAAEVAGLSVAEAVDDLAATRVRVLAIGFAPGQPYMGLLGEHWNLPRQTALTPMVPPGALVLAIRQLVLFTNSSPTGWRHVGQTRFRNFDPAGDPVFALKPGDEMQFDPCPADSLETRPVRREGLP